uniref:Uncharacterized protein n=1 Tax=Arundo donax TaxID=35708 RepID=A0A0A9E8J7_ARUDO
MTPPPCGGEPTRGAAWGCGCGCCCCCCWSRPSISWRRNPSLLSPESDALLAGSPYLTCAFRRAVHMRG